MIKKNVQESIWEIIPLYALQTMFPKLKWGNEYALSQISANSESINAYNRRYDIYSPVIKAAVEVSRIRAHSTAEQIERDQKKQIFSNEAGVTLFHICEKSCYKNDLTHVHTFITGKDTKNINFPITTLAPAIEELALDIEKTFQIKRVKNVNYGDSLDEIRAMFYKITGKHYDESFVQDLSDRSLSRKLNVPVNKLRQFAETRQIESVAAFCQINNNTAKFVQSGNFFAKNIEEANIAENIIKSKDDEIRRLKQIIAKLEKKCNCNEL